MVKSNKRRQSLATDAEIDRVCLHEVAKLNPNAELGPRHILQISHDRLRKLSKRLWGIDSEESNGQMDYMYTTGRTEYGHLVEVTNQTLNATPFDVITGPFKQVDSGFLIDQIPFKYPEQKIEVRYKSGKTEWLTTLTRFFTEEDSQQLAAKSGKDTELQERAKRYKKKKQKKTAKSRQRSVAADDDIATLIANAGNAALTVDNTGKINTSKSANQMVSDWQEKETKTKIVVYDSSSDESVISEDKIIRADNLDTVLLEREETTSCWQRFKSCCCASSSRHGRGQSLVTPLEEVYGSRSLREDKASERLWLPPTEQIIAMQTTVRAVRTYKRRDSLAGT